MTKVGIVLEYRRASKAYKIAKITGDVRVGSGKKQGRVGDYVGEEYAIALAATYDVTTVLGK